jgi:Cdc6-like AAA superfamily ATPase
LARLSESRFWSPLPCHEKELASMNAFFRNSFSSEFPRALIVSGPPESGKTSALKICASMSPHSRDIVHIDCRESPPFRDDATLCPDRRLLIIDSLDPDQFDIGEILDFYGGSNVSLVFVPITPVSTYCIPPAYCPAIVSFSLYLDAEMFEILKEKVANFRCIPDELLGRIAVKISRERGTVGEAVRLLEWAIRVAISAGRAVADVELPTDDDAEE